MSHLTTCEDSRSATSSPELASGLIPCASPDGLTINQSGLAPARASLSARQAKEMGLLTSGTFGPTSSTSSASADLSMSLANRLQLVTQTHGSTLYRLTWKEWDTPSGLCRLRQRASALRTSESELIGWPSPLASNVKNCYQDWLKVMARKDAGRQPNPQDFAVLTAWPTPTTESAMREKRYAQDGMPFSMAAALGGEQNSPVDNSSGGSEPDPDANNAMLNGYVAPGGMGEFGKFQMHDNWKPDPQFVRRASQWGINLKAEITPFELADFITYWKAEGKAFHHDQWQQKLARSVQQSRARPVAQQQRRDINEVPEPDKTIPQGFRGYQAT